MRIIACTPPDARTLPRPTALPPSRVRYRRHTIAQMRSHAAQLRPPASHAPRPDPRSRAPSHEHDGTDTVAHAPRPFPPLNRARAIARAPSRARHRTRRNGTPTLARMTPHVLQHFHHFGHLWQNYPLQCAFAVITASANYTTVSTSAVATSTTSVALPHCLR
eukprot:1450882-Pleurochrysis_carterae.AAC.1